MESPTPVRAFNWETNPRPFGVQADALTSAQHKPHHLGYIWFFKKVPRYPRNKSPQLRSKQSRTETVPAGLPCNSVPDTDYISNEGSLFARIMGYSGTQIPA